MPDAEIDAPVRRSVNGHTLELRATYWRCLQCDHRFENVADAEGFWCGDDCAGRHIPPGAVKVGYHPCVGCGNLVPPDVEWCGGCPIPPGEGS